MEKAYSKKSNIKGTGMGLFAKDKINKGSRIAKFGGRVCRPGVKLDSNRSNVFFNDGYILACDENDLASFANDCINLPKKRRKFVESMGKDEPFYKRHKDTIVNSSISLNEKNFVHEASLVATRDIEKDEEIYVHYGFTYWFYQEAMNGYSCEQSVEKNGFPENIFEFPGFSAYVREFYPDSLGHEIIKENDGEFTCKIKCEKDRNVYVPLPDCKKLFVRYNMDTEKISSMV